MGGQQEVHPQVCCAGARCLVDVAASFDDRWSVPRDRAALRNATLSKLAKSFLIGLLSLLRSNVFLGGVEGLEELDDDAEALRLIGAMLRASRGWW